MNGGRIIKFNKFLIVLLTFTLILGIGCVSAAESTQDIIVNDNQISINDIENQDISNIQESNSCNATNFNELRNYIQTHDVIELENNITRQNGESSIAISKDLVIDGKGHTINANGLRVFQVSSGKLTLKNLTLINGYDAGDGGAIHSLDSVECYNCIFRDNRAGDHGGALIAVKNVILYNCVFENNRANDDNGGAINVLGNLECYNTTFTNNHAHWDGGAIFCNNKVTIKDCNFINNSASGARSQCYGGAIRSKGDTECYNSTFTGNEADDYGGAIYGNNVMVKDCIFEDNRANGNNGGAIYADGGVKCINSSFYTNWAIVHGGAIYAKGFVECRDSTFTDNYCDFEDEKGFLTPSGGAIYAHKISVYNSEFTGNHISSKGGAIYADEVQQISNSKFTSCSAEDGGAIYVNNNCNFKISDCEFRNNKAQSRGGAIFVSSRKSHITVHHNIFINNRKYTIYTYGYYDCIDHNYYGTPNPNFNENPGIFVEHKGVIIQREVKHYDNTYFKTLEDYNNYVEREGDSNPWDSTIYEDYSENNSDNNSNISINNDSIPMEHTGFPLIVVLLAIFVLPIVRFKK